MAVESLWKTLERLLRERGLGSLLELGELREAWRRIAPESLKGARPLALKGGILYLGVPNHPMAQEARLRAPSLLERLKEEGYAVRALRTQVLSLPPPPSQEEPRVEVRPEDVQWAAAELAKKGIPEGLQRAFLGLMAAARARERALLEAGGKNCRECGAPFLGPGELCPTCLIHARHGGEG